MVAAGAIWGPNLVDGVLVGAGDKAARVLTPHVAHGDRTLADVPSEYTVEL